MLLLGSEKSINAIEILMNSGLDWAVTKENLQTASGIVTDHIAIVREDNNTILGVHKSGYEVFQNQQLAELVLTLSQVADAPIHSAGMLKGGGKVYIQLKTGDLTLGSDQVRGYCTVVNSFDGSTSLGAGNSTTTISCMNTFFGAYKQLDAKIKHTKSLTIRVEDLLRSMDIFRKDESNHFDLIRRLASAPVTLNAVNAVYKGMFDVSFNEADENRKASANDRKLSSKKTNLIETFTADTLNQLQDKGQNLWGLFSGVTKYTTHHLGSNSEETKMFGSVANKERAILHQFAELVK